MLEGMSTRKLSEVSVRFRDVLFPCAALRGVVCDNKSVRRSGGPRVRDTLFLQEDPWLRGTQKAGARWVLCKAHMEGRGPFGDVSRAEDSRSWMGGGTPPSSDQRIWKVEACLSFRLAVCSRGKTFNSLCAAEWRKLAFSFPWPSTRCVQLS